MMDVKQAVYACSIFCYVIPSESTDEYSLSLWLVQVSQYTFAMCSYREKKAEPVELLQLDGYTVDYTDPQPGNSSIGPAFQYPYYPTI